MLSAKWELAKGSPQGKAWEEECTEYVLEGGLRIGRVDKAGGSCAKKLLKEVGLVEWECTAKDDNW